MDHIAVTLLLNLSALLGVHAIPEPQTFAGTWSVTKPWVTENNYPMFEASSTAVPDMCREHPEDTLSFPAVIQGAQSIFLDNQVIATFGDSTFRTVRSFYGAPEVHCKEILGGKVLTWKVYSYTHYFARISFMPELRENKQIYNVFAETLHVIAAGVTLVLVLFTFTMFYGKVSLPLTLSISLACLGLSFYFTGTVAGLCGIHIDMMTCHKIADLGVWSGMLLLNYAFYLENLFSKNVLMFELVCVLVGSLLILTGTSGDAIQMGTSLPFVSSIFVLNFQAFQLIRSALTHRFDRRRLLQLFSLGFFILACFNEMSVVAGLLHSSPLLPLGSMGGIFFLSLAVNDKVIQTYRERDHLRSNLELEVQRQTAEISQKSVELELAMHHLQHTQAELVQSAKLASIGTLSAGIAHEINNSLNYVNGALTPLEKLLERSSDQTQKEKVGKLLGVMKEGLRLTLDIIQSLRSYTGLNQAKFNDVNIHNVVESVLKILRGRIRAGVEVIVDVPETLNVFGSVVGLNQTFMNLITNALDALPAGGQLRVMGRQVGEQAEIQIVDNGVGIPATIRERIFEPFFTTKEVGSGTGLGLYIVKTEMDRHQGRISLASEPGQGTTFTLLLPLKESSGMSREGAA